MTTTTELTGARHALDVALNHLNEAETDYILTLTDMVKHYIYRTEAAEAKVDIAAAELASIRCPADDDGTRRDVFNTCAKCTIYAPEETCRKCWSDYLEQKAKEATK